MIAPDALRRRLAWDGVPPEEADAFLRSLSPCGPPRRFAAIQTWLRNSRPISAADPPTDGPAVSFVELWQRIAAAAMTELAASLPRAAATHYQTERDGWGAYRGVYRDLRDDLVTKLSIVGEPVVWESLNRRRTPGQIVMAHLAASEGGQAAVRTIYCRLLEELRGDGLRSITDAYPVLRRHLSTTVDQWLRYSAEILVRVFADHAALLATFGLPGDATLAHVRQNLSDPHRGGRTVAMLTFSSTPDAVGTAQPHLVVYKPKELGIDREFQRLLSDLPKPDGAGGPFRTITVLSRAGYGYMERIPHRTCVSERELQSFYRNAGRLTAVLHLLGGTDCHHENLIACGEHLVLVDAETLFEGIPRDHRTAGANGLTYQTDLYKRFGNSVIRLGLLPEWHFVAERRIPRDVSALGIQPPPSPREEVVGWVALNTDGMISGKTERPAILPTSLPVGFGAANRLGDFATEFCDGFTAQLTAIRADRRRWLTDGCPLVRFRTLRRRFIPRPTWLYLWLRRQQIEPEALSSERDQRLVLENLARSYLVATARPRNWPLFAAEVAQMQELDVPFFEHSVDDRELRLSDELVIADYFELSGYENARQKLLGLDESSIAFESRVLRGVITARAVRISHDTRSSGSPSGDQPQRERADADRLNDARAIARSLVDGAIADGSGAVEWLGIDVAEDIERLRYGPLGLSVYSGRSGIALFLAALARVDDGHGDALRRTAVGACSDLPFLNDAPETGEAGEAQRWWRDQPLGLAGSGGVLLALTHLAELIPELSAAASQAVSRLVDALDVELLRSDHRLDVMFGGAGLIGPLLRIGSARALALADEAGRNLVRRQHPEGGWVVDAIGTQALTGFSHGAAGMAAALAGLHAVTGGSAYRDAAAAALRYERATFDARERNWPDLRGGADPQHPRFVLSWCHGAPGVALSRLCLTGTALWDADASTELDHALASTATSGLPGDSVCCGRFGRAAILRAAASARRQPAWLDAALRIERNVAGDRPFPDRLGLFTGAAGIGLALLDGASGEDQRLLPSIMSAGLW